jgi:hypothetical protein
MTARKKRSSGSDMARVDAHVVRRKEYQELPELTDEMLERGTINKGGRPRMAERFTKKIPSK